jgi:anaerobic magnesium-protoporphyrin IX monomethyl ester cyclase
MHQTMNVLLIHPSSYFKKRILNEITMPDMPLGLAYIAAILELANYNVKIVDLNVIKTKDDLKSAVTGMHFDIAGFTSTTSNILNCYRTIRVIKKLLPSVITVLGGWHASGIPVQTLQECADLDIVVKGEGEETMKELVGAIEQHKDLATIQGVVYRNPSGQIIENPDRPLIPNLDDLPFPARHLLPMDDYKKRGFNTSGVYFKTDRYISGIVTSRGCTGQCIFCADHTIYKHRCRMRSPENVVAEIKHAMEEFKVSIFFFQDAHFTQSPTRAKKICELIIKENLQILWACSARVDTVNKELLQLMKQAGCARIGYGIETGSPKMLKIMNKHVKFKQMRDAIKWTKEAGMISFIYLVYGVPGENATDIHMTRQLLMELKPDFVNQTIAIPYPGTKLREIAIEQGLIKNDDWEFYSFPYGNVIDYPGFDEMFKLQGKILKEFYTSPFFMKRMVSRLRSIYQVLFYFKVLRIYLLGFLLFSFGTKESVKRVLSGISSRNELQPLQPRN